MEQDTLNEIEKAILDICIEKDTIPTKANIMELYGVPYSSLRRLDVSLNNIRKYIPSNIKLCLNCNRSITSRQGKKFCSLSCSVSFNNRLKTVKIINRSCINCNNTLKRHQKKYCSHKCQFEYIKIEKIKSDNFSHKSAKNYLIEKFGNQCSECKITEWNGKPIILELDHIDGNHENNSLLNLTILCPNCHSQTPTYKGRNRGNGRHSRRKRYKEGKSYQ